MWLQPYSAFRAFELLFYHQIICLNLKKKKGDKVVFNIVKSFVLRQLLAIFVSSGFAFLTAYSSAWNRSPTKELSQYIDRLSPIPTAKLVSTEEYKNIAVRKNTFQPTHKQKR